MKILHTGDWHLGKKLGSFSRLEEQAEVLEEITQILEDHDIDVVLIAGDLFDTFNPPVEAIDLFYKTVKKMTANGKRPVVAIAGNHDSPERIEAPDPLARECGIIFAGYPYTHIPPFRLDSGLEVSQSEPGFIELKIPGQAYPLRLILAPYSNESRLKTFSGLEDSESEMRRLLQEHWKKLAVKYCDDKGINILLSHLYFMKKDGTPPEEPESEKSILHIGGAQTIFSENIPQNLHFAAVGHLHRYQVIDTLPCPVVYSSSPLGYSFSEAGQNKYVVIIEANPGAEATYSKVELQKGRKLYRKRFEGIDPAISWLREHPYALIELTIATDEYLTAADRKQLFQAHDGIISLIPDLKTQGAHRNADPIDLSQSINDLFIRYFTDKHKVPPSAELLALFHEINALNPSE